MSKTVEALNKNIFQPRGWGRAPLRKAKGLPEPWLALDTERDRDSADFICAWAYGEKGAIGGDKIYDFPPGTYWIWNLPYDIEGMLRDLNTEQAWAARKDATSFPIGDAICKYYHGKRFDWNDKDGLRVFAEASSFYGRAPLRKICPEKLDIDASLMSKRLYDSYPGYKKVTDEYCIQDAKAVYDTIMHLRSGIESVGGQMKSTPGGTARTFINMIGDYPNVLWDTQRQFLRSYGGGRFENVKLGWIENAYKYDLVSAYSWALSECPWLTETAYSRYSRRINEEACYGTYKVSYRSDEYLGVAPTWHCGVRTYSGGENTCWVAKPEAEYLRDNATDFQVLDGMEIVDENATDDWKRSIEGLFDIKKKEKGTPRAIGAKAGLVSTYGVLIQLQQRGGQWAPLGTFEEPDDFCGTLEYKAGTGDFEAGDRYAPAYAGHVTALTRVRILEAAKQTGEENYVGALTDSIITTKKMPTSWENPALGGWMAEESGEAIITKTGMYAIGNKVKMRGITRTGSPTMLLRNKHSRKSRLGIKTCGNWGDVSKIITKDVANNLFGDKKRRWDKPLTAKAIRRRELIDSQVYRYING